MLLSLLLLRQRGHDLMSGMPLKPYRPVTYSLYSITTNQAAIIALFSSSTGRQPRAVAARVSRLLSTSSSAIPIKELSWR
jgi:hypothetical protein